MNHRTSNLIPSLVSSFSNQDAKIVKEEVCFKGFFQITKLTFRHRLFEGGWSPELSRERFDRGPAVGVLLFDSNTDEVVLIEQFRVGALNEASPWIFEIVAGMIEPGETPEAVAIRETYEESGTSISKLTHICNYLVSPGGADEKMHLYMAEVDSQHISGCHGLPEEGEDIKVHKISTEDAFEAVRQGSINNAATIISLQWLEIQRLKGIL
ncbi:MAG: ADP-ribose pyrophosphatase [Crocinitomicaceae bacterium]|jgi:ADP-ribose pyrophosphatase